VITVLLAIAVAALAAALAYEAYQRRLEKRIYRGLLAEESAQRIAMDRRIDGTAAHLIGRRQRHAEALEQTIADTQCALMWTAWRLSEAGVLTEADAPANDVETIN
jgi:hypothetical protein